MDVLLESLKLGVAPSIVVLIYLVFNKIVENKTKSKQVVITNNIVESFNKLNNFLDYFTKNIINKELDKCDLQQPTQRSATLRLPCLATAEILCPPVPVCDPPSHVHGLQSPCGV